MTGRTVIKVFGFYVLQQDEIGVRLTLGKYSGIVRPGLGFAVPILQKIIKTTSSLQTVDLPDQQIVLSGNISVTISGNLNFRVLDPAKAMLELADYRYTVRQLALTTIADVLGTKTIEEVRTQKPQIADEVERIVGERALAWGLSDIDIRLTDALLDESLLRAMMRETEAKKEAQALQIKADSDRRAAELFSDAARTLATSPGAMTLRVLQTLSDVSAEKSTIIMPIPTDMLSVFGNGATQLARPAQPSQDSVATGQLASTIAHTPAASHAEAPLCQLDFQSDKTVARCPHCRAKFNVTEVLGDMRYDRLPEVPGQQIKCSKCEGLFTLPGTE